MTTEADALSVARDHLELAGLLANTLDEAMQRLHNIHGGTAWTSWRACDVSTLCREAAQLFDRHDTQTAVAVARVARGEPASG